MAKLKILVPLDGTEKSTHSLIWIDRYLGKEDLEITLLNVVQVFYNSDLEASNVVTEFKLAQSASNRILDEAAAKLEGYKVNKLSLQGSISDNILEEAETGKYDLIVMTKSSIKGISRIIGSVTAKVVRNSRTAVIVVPE